MANLKTKNSRTKNIKNQKSGKSHKLKLSLIIAFGAVLFVIVLVFALRHFGLIPVKLAKLYDDSKNYHVEEYNDKTYHIIDADYSGEYSIEYKLYYWNNDKKEVPTSDDFESFRKVMNFSEYSAFASKYGFWRKYADANVNYIVYPYIGSCSVRAEARLANVEKKTNSVNLYIYDDLEGCAGMSAAYMIVVPVDKNEVPTSTLVETTALITKSSFTNIKNRIENGLSPYELGPAYKPILYLYPEEETEVTVKLGKPENITVSYPKYTTGWNVLAEPNGDLTDLETGKSLYSLYYESKNSIDFKVYEDGFIVKGEDSAKFLEEKLSILGLTEREAEEFIIYWLPKLESSGHNYIRFASDEEIAENMPLEISPKPDNIIRVLIIFKGLKDSEAKSLSKTLTEQSLKTPTRSGFTVVEWGGSEIK